MGITEVLTIIFIVLKLLGKIDWSWWVVCLPEILGLALYILVVIASAVHQRRISKHIFDDMKKW